MILTGLTSTPAQKKLLSLSLSRSIYICKILKIVQMSKTAPDEKKFYASNPGKTSACPPCTTM